MDLRGTQRLAQVFVELADTLVEEFDVVDLMHVLTERSVELLDADAAGLMLADQRGELQIQEGPCRESFLTGRAITNVALGDARDRWPVFTPAAVEAGFRSTHALPMRLRGQVIGALNLFTDQQVSLEPDAIAVAQAMVDVATIGLLHERNLHEQTILSEQLQTTLHSRVLIEPAKGMLACPREHQCRRGFRPDARPRPPPRHHPDGRRHYCGRRLDRRRRPRWPTCEACCILTS